MKSWTLALCFLTAATTAAAAEQTLGEIGKPDPVRKWEVYILMHSHNDIGYTDIQPNIAKKQARNVLRALELIQKTKDYPAGARFKWNLEVLMPYEDFHAIAAPEQERQFEQAVRDGSIGVDAMYANLLTGVCRSEELLRQFTFATALGRRCGVKVDSMMISDVPGLTWGVVPALVQNGVKYISDGPNYFDRIGYARLAWEDKPFYWLAPNGRDKVLYWSPYYGYAYGHTVDLLTDAAGEELARLEKNGYPYDIVQMRWSKGDNGLPDERVMDQVRDWNAKHAYPKFIIATTSQMFHDFENRYADKVPTFRGDFTPYWEDGTASSARETGMNRRSADRLLQAETIWAMKGLRDFPAAQFAAAWKNIALYSEHTWGAFNSISDPDLPFVKAQWKFKQAWALNADEQSRKLLDRAVAGPTAATAALDVFNTSSWPRTELVTLGKESKGNDVKDEQGAYVPSQRLSTGELVFLARDVPPFGARRYKIETGSPAVLGVGVSPASGSNATASGTTLATPTLTVKVDSAGGAIASIHRRGIDAELVDGQVNGYLYLPGGNVKDARPNGSATVAVKEAGPLVASLLVESQAPGCRKLLREVRVVDGLDRVEMIDQVDKLPVRAPEGVHFAFQFNVPDARVRVNSPLAVVEPEKDQLPGACKNWFSVERWVDVANDKYGVTWATADAPLMEMGGLTAHLPRQQGDPNAYLKTIAASPKLYSWAMNNHWETNYRAEQEGWTTFRYAVRPHGSYDAVAAARFGVESTLPLIAAPAAGEKPAASRLTIEPADVLATALKPGDDGKALIVRLYGASGKNAVAKLAWARPEPRAVWLSDASEQPLKSAPEAIEVPAWGMVTLRAELPQWLEAKKMRERELIQRLIAGEQVERCGLWLGKPNVLAWPALHAYFQTETEEHWRQKLGDDCRWIGPQSYKEQIYRDPSGRGMFDSGLDREKYGSVGPLAHCETIEQIEGFPWPNPDYLDLEPCLHDLRKAGDFYRLSGFWTCFFHNISDLFGMEEYLVKMHVNPDVVQAVTDKVCGFYYEANERFFQAAGNLVDGFFFGNDFGTQQSLICGPRQFDEFILPWFVRFTEQGHRHGHQVVLHSCGAIHPAIEKLLAAGVDCLHPLQALAKDMDAQTLARDFKGRVAFMGGIDMQILLTHGTPEQVRGEVRRVKRLLGPNLIVSPSHEAILPNVPPENIEAMALAANEGNSQFI